MSKIYINPGHGGSDSGAVGIGGRKEKDDNLRYATEVARRLEAAGHTVKLERSNDTFISVTNIAKKANYWGADYFIAFHRNAANGKANGSETLIVPKASATSKKLAQATAEAMASAGFKNRGVKVQSKNVYVLANTTMPATTIECGFIDNETDNKIFDEKFDKITTKISLAILSVVGGAKAPEIEVVPPKEPSASIPTLGRVLKKGTTGEDVRMLQERLKKHRAYFDTVDGKFGSKTHNAVVAFQSARIKEGRDVGCRYNNNKRRT